MNTRIYIIAILFATSLFFVSCNKDKNNNNTNNDIDNFLDLDINQNFDFESFSNLETSIKLANTKSSGFQIIQIYDAHPAKGGKLILTGSANDEGVFNLPIRIASRLDEVYVAKLSSSGANEYVAVPVEGSSIQFDFSSKKSTKSVNTWCDCDTQDYLANNYNADLEIFAGDTYCIADGNFATIKKLKLHTGGTLNICGTVTIQKFHGSGNQDGSIIVSPTGFATIQQGGMPHNLDNYGTLNFSSHDCSLDGILNNWGTISSTVKIDNKGTIVNDGTITTSEEFKINSDGSLINNCQFYIVSNSKSVQGGSKQDFKQNGDFTNNGYLQVEDEAEFTGSGNKKTTLGIGSLIDTKDFKINGEIVGVSNPGAQITASDDGRVNASADITNVDLCADDPSYNNNADYTNVTYCINNITAPSCDANIAPIITSSLQIGGLVGESITPYLITASGTEPVTYTVGSLPAGLSFDANTHTISGSPTTAGTYSVDMTASNFMGDDTKTLVITVTQPTAPPVITSVLTGSTTVNEPYTYQITASGEPTISFNATNLPAGLSFNSTTNQIEGSPESAGTFNILLSATNDGGTTNETLVLTVGTPPTITSDLTASGTADVQFTTYTFTASESPSSYTVAGLPQGLSFNESNQTIVGTPTFPGTFNVTLTASNQYGSDVETLIITIAEGLQPPTITSLLTASGMKDFAFSYTITAVGSQPMSFTASTLPEGLSFDGTTISGIPTESGVFTITLGAINAAGTDSKDLVLTISTGGGADTDGDTVPDNLDAYPNDPTRAYNSFYPNETDFGSFAFEDLWPGYGDYDFNDFVVNFNYEIVTNAQNEVVDVITKFQIMAAGASQNNGFGIEFDVPPTVVESVTGCMKFGNAVQIDPKGFELGHTNSTVIIPFDAISNIMDGGMVNTVPGGRYIQTLVTTVTTHFAIPQASIGTPPFNPFIFVNQTRGYEVHLKNQPPTELVDPDYFDTYHDVSDPELGTYYVSESGLPWGIEVPVNFNYPVEKADILTAYLKFASWAQSSGAQNPDWYENNAGYRNSANIYVIP